MMKKVEEGRRRRRRRSCYNFMSYANIANTGKTIDRVMV
jgi:hypothetical protein